MGSNSKDCLKPGDLQDKRGVPVYPGDLLKAYHFTDVKRRKHYIYHVVTERYGRLWATPTAFLHRTSGGGECLLDYYAGEGFDFEVISGCGPGEILDFNDRPKAKR